MRRPALPAQQRGDQIDWPRPLDTQSLDLLPTAVTASYRDDFSLYPLGETPADWSWHYRGEGLTPPVIILFSGGDTDDYKRLEIDQPYSSAENWLIKNDIYYGPAQQVEAIVNFQTNGTGLAGIVLGWKDPDNFSAVMLDDANDTVWILTYSNGSVSAQSNGTGSTVIEPNVDYRLIAHMPEPLARGMSYVNVWLEPFQGNMDYLFTSEQPLDVRGRMGVGVSGGSSRVVFDDFWVDGLLLPTPTADWTAPGASSSVVDVYGDWIELAASATDDIAIWRARFWRWDWVNLQSVLVAEFDGPPPYERTFNTGDLYFGWNELNIELVTVNEQSIWPAYLWLNRLRVPETIIFPITGLTLTADGQSTGQIVVTVQDRGNHPLPEVPLTFTGENASVDPATVLTDNSGQATVTITAGTIAGRGKVIVISEPGELEVEVPLTLLPGPPASLQVEADATELVADGASTANVSVVVLDAYGNRAPDVTVSFATTLGTIGSSAVTDASGQATVQFIAGTELGQAEITAQCGTAPDTSIIMLVAGPPAQLTVSANPASLLADGVSKSEVRAAVTDAYTHPLAGRTIQFSTTEGAIDASAVTNAQGEAVATLTAGGDVSSAQVRAMLGNLSANIWVAFVPAPAASLQLNMPQSEVMVEENENVEVPFTVTVRDTLARPLADVTVNFASTLGSITPAAVTGGNGVATAVLASNGAIGRAIITASANDISVSTEVTFKRSGATLYLSYIQLVELPPTFVNGSFEAGPASGWTQLVNGAPGKLIYRQNEYPNVIPTPVTSPYIAWLGGEASRSNQLYQLVTLPMSYDVVMEYWHYIKSYETDCSHDSAAVNAYRGGMTYTLNEQALCSSNDTPGWVRREIDLSSLRGLSIAIGFSTKLDAQINSNWFIDSVRLCSRSSASPGDFPRCGQ